ncbi:MAG: PLP-dependent aminotransferase family protein [Oscillospiraceae bacterium]|nr:PLP-dependent aminotransferase family protein [Oscillospiraceae bacterium]
MNYNFSAKVSGLQASAIREILKFTAFPDVISFAAGNPAPEAFPAKEIAKISAELVENEPILALQYSITEGYTPLRDTLKTMMSKKNCFSPDNDELIITSGAQQGIELSCKSFCNEGDTLIAEAPSFIGSLNAFRSYNVNLVGVEMEDDGIVIDKLEQTLKANPNTKIIYVIPNFQNPTGRTMSFEKRKAVYDLACKYDVMILEDNPYGDLRFEGEDIPSIKSLDTQGRVIYVGSFSKVLAPGLRVGYVSAPKEVIQKIVVCKQVADVHTNIWAQVVCDRFIKENDFDAHIRYLRGIYRKKYNLMRDCIEANFSKKITFSTPQGGLFVWGTLPSDCDMTGFCKKAVADYKVAVVPGNAFLIKESDPTTSFRLNYSTPTDEQIIKGCEMLGKLSKDMFD